MKIKNAFALIVLSHFITFAASAADQPQFQPWSGGTSTPPKWYAQIQGSVNYMPGEVFEQTQTPNNGIRYDLDSDFGFGGAFSLGYRPGDVRGGSAKNFRFELEGAFRSNEPAGDFDAFIGPRAVSLLRDVSVDTYSVMANVYYDIKSEGDSVYPYIGAGLGAAKLDVSVDTTPFEEDEIVFAYQGTLGLAYSLGEYNTLFMGYRYFGTDDVEISELDKMKVDGSVHELNAGYRLEF